MCALIVSHLQPFLVLEMDKRQHRIEAGVATTSHRFPTSMLSEMLKTTDT